jgi:hypothetical protein
MKNLAGVAIADGGSVHPLIIPYPLTNGTGIMNPSIYNDDENLIVNIRHVNYTFYHSEKKTFQHPYGPLTYVHPENDMHLRTDNYYCELDGNLSIKRHDKIKMAFDTYKPMWDFVGLEDARIFRWNGQLYICGVRRDTTANGQGRMELCGMEVKEGSVVETSRIRIQPPNDPNSYCEKNWMPILDKPFHFIKWSNPTEVVELLDDSGKTRTVSLSDQISLPRDIRGGSQIMPWGDCYIAITHEVDLFKSEVGRKDARYLHRFLVWNKDFQIIACSREFSIMGGQVEFAVGLCRYKNDILVSYGFQDNAAYILRMRPETLVNFINESEEIV